MTSGKTFGLFLGFTAIGGTASAIMGGCFVLMAKGEDPDLLVLPATGVGAVFAMICFGIFMARHRAKETGGVCCSGGGRSRAESNESSITLTSVLTHGAPKLHYYGATAQY